MNQWGQIRNLAIVESDDTEDHYERNGLNFLFYWKAKYPKFKITLFTIPNKTSPGMLELLRRNGDWIELAVHGFNHSSNFECFDWDYEKTKELMGLPMRRGYSRNFKAPGWTITPKDVDRSDPDNERVLFQGCGYEAAPEQLIYKDKQGVYKALAELDFVVTDRHYNRERRIEGAKYICVDCNPDIVHMHTWDMPRGSEPNGYRQVEEIQGVPWDQDTEFVFMSEAIERNLIQRCKR